MTFATLFRNAVDDAAEERTNRRGVAGAQDVPPIEVRTKPGWRRERVDRGAPQPQAPLLVRTARLRRIAWRLIPLLLLVNLVLGAIVTVDRGELPPFSTRPNSLAAGVEARVNVDQLNLRAAPGNDAPVLRSIRFGTRGEITGEGVAADDAMWWPVTFTLDGEDVSGFVWSGGIEPAGTGIAGDIQRGVDDIRRSIGETFGWTP